MQRFKGTGYLGLLILGGFLMATAALAQEGFRTNKLLLDDDAVSLADRNTITLLSPVTGTLTTDYSLRLPVNDANMVVGSMMFAEAVGASTDLAWLAPGTPGQVLRIDTTSGLPYWATILELPVGTVDNSTLRWDDATGQWVENINLLSDVDGNTVVNGTIEVNGPSATINSATTTIASATVTVENIPQGVDSDTNVVLRDASNNLVIRSINDLIDDATLSENAIWYGDASNNPIELAAGTMGQVLRIDSTTGSPYWANILELPYGTTDNSTLRWDLATGQWVENVNLRSDVDGNTVVEGTVEINGTTTTINSATVTTPNIPAGVDGDTNVVLRDASDNLVVRSINDLIEDATLSENAIWYGDPSNNPIELAAGTQGQVLRIDSTTGSPTWSTILELPYGTVDNSTLRWDLATGQWVENVNLRSDVDGNTVVEGTVEINGTSTTINSATVTTPNIPAGVDGDTNVVLRDASDNLVVRSINDLIDDATLSENAIWYGDPTNNPIELAAGTQGQVLRIDSTTGSPTWSTILELPYGTVDNSTLRWDLATGQWVENVNLRSDVDGNTVVEGTVEINGTTTTINSTTVTTPNIPAGVDGDTNVVLRDASDNLVVRSINDLIDDATLSENAIWYGDATNNPIELAAGTQGQVLRIDSTTGSPYWANILELPYGTVDNSTLRWDDATQQWVENVNLLSDTDGNTTINGTTITTPNIGSGVDNDTNIVIRDANDELKVRSINELISDATLSENAIWVGDASNNPIELAAGTQGQVLRIDSTTNAPYWANILELPYGTVDNSTLRWDDATQQWVENINLLSDASGNTRVNGTMYIDGDSTTINSSTVHAPNIGAGADNDTNIVIRDGNNDLKVRSINELISDATLSHNAIWVGDVNNNPVERPAGDTNQVLQIAADGTPQWQDLNLVFQGRVATAGTLTQTIANTAVTGTGAIVVSYEDPANGARVSVDVTTRSAGTSFEVGFSALPPAGTFVNYTIIP